MNRDFEDCSMKPCSFVASISILSLLVTTAHALRQAKPLSFFARRSCCEKLFNSWTACCSCSGNTFRGEVDSGDCPALHGLVQSVRSRKGHGVLTEAHTHTRTHTHTHTHSCVRAWPSAKQLSRSLLKLPGLLLALALAVPSLPVD